jgi:hypothetical protein
MLLYLRFLFVPENNRVMKDKTKKKSIDQIHTDKKNHTKMRTHTHKNTNTHTQAHTQKGTHNTHTRTPRTRTHT